ncbi:MAG: peptidase U32 family protein [Thermodesulfobacteriota bacterium]
MGYLKQLPLPEILAPAGNLERLHTALAYAPDAVYLAGPGLNLRSRGQNFTWRHLEQGIALARARDCRVYFCLNLLAQQGDLALIQDYLERLKDYPLQGLIVADPGVLDLARQKLPDLPLHLSTQANTSNAQAARFWQSQGVARVNLARELDLKALRSIREQVPDLELEIFVHGAQCLALSGRCLLSACLNSRSANQGLCTQPCRFQYQVRSISLEEKERPGTETLHIDPGEEFEQILAPEDLCLVKYLPWLVRIGINSLKIEGRMRSSSYLAQVLDVYKTALADLQQGRFRPNLYLQELKASQVRPLSSGFFLPGGEKKIFSPKRQSQETPVLGKVLEALGSDRWLISVRHRWQADQALHLLLPGLRRPLVQPGEYGLEDEQGRRQQVVHSGREAVLRLADWRLQPGFMLRLAS